MDDLLAQLGRDPVRTRLRWLLALLVVVLAATTVYSLTRGGVGDRRDVCDGAQRELAQVWNGPRKSVVKKALLATNRAYAEPAWDRVSAGLHEYSSAWVDMHTEACRAHQRGEQSGALLDKRMTCLGRRRAALGSAVSVLMETDETSLERVVDVVQKLPAITTCANVEALAAEVAPPEDPGVATQVDALRAELARATALEHAGRYTPAGKLVDDLLAKATPLVYQPLMAEILLEKGRLAMLTVQIAGRAEVFSPESRLGPGIWPVRSK